MEQENGTATPTPSVSSLESDLPVLPKLELPPNAEAWLKGYNPQWFESYQALQTNWKHPFTQITGELVLAPQFRDSVKSISEKQHFIRDFVLAELLLLTLMMALRAWRISATPIWWKKWLIQVWIGLLQVVLAWTLVPFLVWGQPYLDLMSVMVRAAIRHLF